MAETTTTKQFWKPIPLSQLQSESEGIEWVWEGIVARRRITLLSAQAKAGKTTLLAHLIRQMQHSGHLLGSKVSKGKAIIVSEESSQDWILRREALNLSDNAEVICLPFMTKPAPAEWLDLLRQGYADIAARKTDLVVFDTLSHLWPVQEENSNSNQQEALMPLRHLSEQGPGVLLIHHAGAGGTRSRGATEVEGFCDQLAHLELANPTDPTSRDRKLTVRGRLTSAPERLQISLNLDGDDYQVVQGNLRPIRSGIWQTLVRLLPAQPPGWTVAELRWAWPDEFNVPSEDTIWRTLIRCAPKAGVRRSDTKPAEWWCPNQQN